MLFNTNDVKFLLWMKHKLRIVSNILRGLSENLSFYRLYCYHMC